MTESTRQALQVSEEASVSVGQTRRNYSDVRLHPAIILLSDLTTITAAWFLTCGFRVLINPLFARHFTFAQITDVAPSIFALLGLWTLMELREWLHAPEDLKQVGSGLLEVSERALVAGLLAIAATFFSRQFGAELSRSFVLIFPPISFLCLTFGRYALVLAAVQIEKQWPRIERIAMLGCSENARAVAMSLQDSDAGCRVVGFIAAEPKATDLRDGKDAPHNVLGTTRELAALINTAHLHRIVLADGHFNREELERCAKIAARMNVVLNLIVDVPSPVVTPTLEDRYGLRLLRFEPVARPAWQNATKRAIDLVGSFSMLAFALPIMLVISLLIRATSPGPILYRSRRVGKGGRHFTFLKFRSMYISAKDMREEVGANEKSGHIFKMRKDPRVTPVGRFLRRTSLDELPQLINVLRGEMSLVGPRPLPAQDLDPDGMSQVFATWAEQRAKVLPGITGLWQIRGRSNLSFDDMVSLDLEYIRCWSLGHDLRIVLETPLALIMGGGAY